MVSTDPGRIVSSQPELLSGGLNRLSSVEKSGSESGRFQPGSSSDEYPDLSGLFLDNFDRCETEGMLAAAGESGCSGDLPINGNCEFMHLTGLSFDLFLAFLS